MPMRAVGTGIVALSLLADVLWMRNELTVYQPAVSVIAVLTPVGPGVRHGAHTDLRPASPTDPRPRSAAFLGAVRGRGVTSCYADC